MPELLDARPTAVPKRDDGEFVDLGWRLVFKEHVNREGVPFGREAMERIADRCNGRIKDDGDFCPIAIRHTKDDGSFDPEVVGFAGPYKAQRLPGSKPKWGIYARWRVYKEDAAKVKKYPRCSVEYWADKDDPTNGYFDPISMLGAETPELDLGIHYSADPRDPGRTLMRYQKVMRYEAVMPGGSNTVVPTNDEPQRYEAQGSLSPADIQQIIAALSPVIKQAVTEQVSAMQPFGADQQGQLAAQPDEPPGDLADDAAAEIPGDDDSDLDTGDDDFADDDDEFASHDDGEPIGDEPGEPEVTDEQPPSDEAEYPADDDESADKKKTHGARYMATANDEVARYQKENADYRKRNDELTKELGDLRTKYQKEVDARRDSDEQLKGLNERMAKIEADGRKAVRYSKLNELQSSGYAFDLEAEMKDCEELSEPQFDKHLDRIRTNYQKVPLPLGQRGLKVAESTKLVSVRDRENEKLERYAKVAEDNVKQARKEGRKLDYARELKRLVAEDPEKIAAA